jgi:SAM-dependent methyltransferase
MASDLLVCLACRSVSEGRIDLRTLERAGDEMVCACGQRYPVIDGVPVILPEAPATDEGDPVREHLSIYIDSHWVTRGPLFERVAALPPVGATVELGSSAGGVLAVLPGDRVIGIELGLAAARRARRLLDGEDVAYERRIIGRHYEPAVARGRRRAAMIACADALDPPLVPGAFDRVVALNVLDSVTAPRQLLAVIDALARPGGEIVLACPYQWIAEDPPFGADPARELVAFLRAGASLRAAYEVLEDDELSWELRRDARCRLGYRIHYVRARKGS